MDGEDADVVDVRARLFDVLDERLDDLPRYMAVSQPESGWLPGEPGQPVMKACVYVDDVREMLRRTVASTRTGGPDAP